MTVHDLPTETRCPDVPSITEIYTRELGVLPEVFREHNDQLGTDPIPRERYYSREFHDLEIEHVFRRTWQLACLASDIPEPGDTHVYDIGRLSIVLVRTAAGAIKAYWNSCLHRGTQLRGCSGRVSQLRCPFHGWSWNLDGSLKDLPGAWDLRHLDRTELALPEVRVDVWEGLVFVNPDPDAMPLAEYMGVLPEHFRRWPMGNRVRTAHAAKIFPANWKVVMDAFYEAYHLVATHPQSTALASGDNAQCNTWGHVSRLIALQGMPAAQYAEDYSEQDILDLTLQDAGMTEPVALPEGMTARDMLRTLLTQQATQRLGLAELPCTSNELLDLCVYYMFPNFALWGGFTFPFLYRFRPYGDDPETSIMDVMVLTPIPDGAPRPEPAHTHWLQPDESFTNVPGMLIPEVFDQDAENMPRIQRGLRSSPVPNINLCRYQESLIRHHHNLLTEYIGRAPAASTSRPAG